MSSISFLQSALSMGKIKSTIENLLPGTYVHSIQIGESDNDDKNAGFFGNVNQQV